VFPNLRGKISQGKVVYIFEGLGLSGDYFKWDKVGAPPYSVVKSKFKENIRSLFISPNTKLKVYHKGYSRGADYTPIDNTVSESGNRWMYVDLSTQCYITCNQRMINNITHILIQ
jgi:hypothetical protein